MTIQWRSESTWSVTMSNQQDTTVSGEMPLSFKWGMKFPLGGDTYVTIRPGDTQPVIEISSYEHFKTPSGHDVVIPKHLGAMLSPKQFTQLVQSGPVILSTINAFTQPMSNTQHPHVAQVKSKSKDLAQKEPRKGRPLKRLRLAKKDTEAKKHDTERSTMNIFSEVKKTNPFMC